MKRNLLLAALVLALVLCAAGCAFAADIRPQEASHYEADLANGSFCLGIRDAGSITDGGYFTAALYLEDHYSAEQIEAMAEGDTVLVNGETWTVREVVPHYADEPGLVDCYEIYTEEENDGYILFSHASDGCYLCITNDWTPVFPVGDVRVMLPLPDAFVYYSGDGDEPGDMDIFLNDLEDFGNTFVPYNTFCSFEDGMLVYVSHRSYPEGPSAAPDEDVEAVEPAETGDAGEIPVWEFCRGRRDGLETAVIKGYVSDCEEGPAEYEMTPEEIEEIRDIAISGVITGQANDLSVTGGTYFYTFETPEGEHLLTIEMYKGWIVDSATGMYNWKK